MMKKKQRKKMKKKRKKKEMNASKLKIRKEGTSTTLFQEIKKKRKAK